MTLIPGYDLKHGSRIDRALLVKFMQRTYRERYPHQDLGHLAATVDQYLAGETKLWWVIPALSGDDESRIQATLMRPGSISHHAPVGCLWLGNAIDQVTGDRHAYVFLLYVSPDHRHQGIGLALMQHAEKWAQARGDRQISLQVFTTNQPALSLYQKLGYTPKATLMAKSLEE